MKQFFTTLLMALVVLFANQTKAETNSSNLNPFKQKGISQKFELAVYQNAATLASKGNSTEWNKIVRVSFGDYCAQIASNVTAGYKPVTKNDVAYMLINSKLEVRHIYKGEKVWGVSPDRTMDYYSAQFDFDADVLVYEYVDASGAATQIDLVLWDCFNPKQCKYIVAPSLQALHDTIYIERERVVREVIREQPQVIYQPDRYYERSGFNWYSLLQLPPISFGYYCMPLSYCMPIFGCLPQYKCMSRGVECGLVPATQQNTIIINNYINVTTNTVINNNNPIVVVRPEVPRPAGTPIYTNTGGGGSVATNTTGGGDFPTGGTSTNTGGGGITTQNTGGAGKTSFGDNIPYSSPRPRTTVQQQTATAYNANEYFSQPMTMQPRVSQQQTQQASGYSGTQAPRSNTVYTSNTGTNTATASTNANWASRGTVTTANTSTPQWTGQTNTTYTNSTPRTNVNTTNVSNAGWTGGGSTQPANMQMQPRANMSQTSFTGGSVPAATFRTNTTMTPRVR